MQESDLAWRVERACHNAWPALREATVGDWCLRFSEGVSRRANSANPLRADIRDAGASIRRCEVLYLAEGMPVLFRILSIIDPAVDARLAQLEYGAEGETLTLYGDINTVWQEANPNVQILPRPSVAWLEAMGSFREDTEQQRDTYRRIVRTVATPAAFIVVREDRVITALAYGAVHDGLLCCESVITGAPYRGRGYARQALTSLFHWACNNGVRAICLQVEATNAPAVSLYRALGLGTELYRYHYRRRPA